MISNTESNLPLQKMNEDSGCSTELSKQTAGCRKVYLAAFASLLFPITMGMVGSFSAIATEDMKRPESRIIPTESEITWIGSLIAPGALVGGAIAGYVTEKIGRKGALMLYSIPSFSGWLFIAYASDVNYVYFGRLLNGLSVGATCAVAPAYLVEISTPDIRGLLGSFFQVCAGLGGVIGAAFAYLMNWQFQAISYCATSVMALVLISVMPESPRWLVAKGHKQKALRALQYLHGPEFDATGECAAICDDLSRQPKGRISFKEMLSPGIYKPALLSVGLIVFQQLCGVNTILFYSVEVFKESSSSLSGYDSTLILHSVMVVTTAASGNLLDRLGRKIMLVVSGVGMAVSLFLLAGFHYVKFRNASSISGLSWLSIIIIMTDVVLFSVGYGPIPWLMIAEMSPNRARGLITGLASAFCWGFVFVVTKSVDFLKLHIHNYGMYTLYGVFCLISCFFTVLCLPETKGKTCEEMQDLFIRKGESKIPLAVVSKAK